MGECWSIRWTYEFSAFSYMLYFSSSELKLMSVEEVNPQRAEGGLGFWVSPFLWPGMRQVGVLRLHMFNNPPKEKDGPLSSYQLMQLCFHCWITDSFSGMKLSPPLFFFFSPVRCLGDTNVSRACFDAYRDIVLWMLRTHWAEQTQARAEEAHQIVPHAQRVVLFYLLWVT